MDKDIEILKILADNFKDRKHGAALSNHLILCNNIDFLNKIIFEYIGFFKVFIQKFDVLMHLSEHLNKDCIDDSKSAYYFKLLIPRIIKNNMEIFEKFYSLTFPDERSGINLENVGKLAKAFEDYNQLVTNTRQFVESVVISSYQILIFDSRELNYQILTSLNSFFKYATKSLKMAVFNDELMSVLNNIAKLSYKSWKKSDITKCKYITFGDKLEYIFKELKEEDNELKEQLNNLYKFSSDFTHIGFVSTFYASASDADIIFGDENGPYLISTENYNELKYEIISTVLKSICTIYNPSLIEYVKKLFIPEIAKDLINDIDIMQKYINDALLSRNNTYYFFITDNYFNSNDDIVLQCRCGEKTIWAAPHKNNDAICKKCGSNFNFIVLEGDPGYIITGDGPARVLGSSAPLIENMNETEREALLNECQKLKNNYKNSVS